MWPWNSRKVTKHTMSLPGLTVHLRKVHWGDGRAEIGIAFGDQVAVLQMAKGDTVELTRRMTVSVDEGSIE